MDFFCLIQHILGERLIDNGEERIPCEMHEAHCAKLENNAFQASFIEDATVLFA